MAPRTRKPRNPAPDAAVEPTAADFVADEKVPEPEPEPEPVAVEVEAYMPPAPQDGVDYVTTAAFSAQLGAQFVSFAEGVILDPLAGAHLADSGAPVKTVKRA